MATTPSSPTPPEGAAGGTTTPGAASPSTSTAAGPSAGPTRLSAVWLATGLALLLLILLIVFILQNSPRVEVQFLWMAGSIPLGMALLIAAVTGGVVVAIAGIARVTQLRLIARRIRHQEPSHTP